MQKVLRLVSSCMRESPASDTWDLRGLVVNGRPVSRFTVTAVLSEVYSGMGALGWKLGPSPGRYSLAQLYRMLWFADAVGCSSVMSLLAGSFSSSVRAELVCSVAASSSGEGAAAAGDKGGAAGSELVTLKLDTIYKIVTKFPKLIGGRVRLRPPARELRCMAREPHAKLCFVKALSTQQEEQLLQQLAQQLEELLFVAFRLHVKELQKAALRFLNISVRHLMRNRNWWADEAIFSQRVLAAAGSASGKELLRRNDMGDIIDPPHPALPPYTPINQGSSTSALLQLLN
ncbi:hypothetical protein OEZ86_013333 [Tetradesmus obliquus]|nr:hypothetical protein OEZ86_013333 [Tetradesmus obliquus]